MKKNVSNGVGAVDDGHFHQVISLAALIKAAKEAAPGIGDEDIDVRVLAYREDGARNGAYVSLSVAWSSEQENQVKT